MKALCAQLIMAGALATLASGCHLFEQTRVPSARVQSANAAEAEPPATAEADKSSMDRRRVLSGFGSVGDGRVPMDDEPDLLPTGDDAPDDVAEPPLSLDRDHDQVAMASRYAALDRPSCEAELNRRHIPYERVGEARGVIAPLRLTGPVSGVTFRSGLPEKQRRTATMEIYDCRLVLALDDLARLLAKHDIVEVIHMSVYRPVSTKVALKGAGRRHGGALAIDAGFFKTKDGRTLSVERDFHGRIGARPCPAGSSATELHQIACEANDARLFNVLLTPDYNWAHRNHFHLEVTAGVRWTLVR
jgi:hypothetical protein